MFEQSNLLCRKPNHQQYNCIFLNFSSEKEDDLLYCPICMAQEQIQKKNGNKQNKIILAIDQIKNKETDQEHIIGWPPIQDKRNENIYQQSKEFLKQYGADLKSFFNYLKKKTENIFNDYQTKINDEIQKLQKETIYELDLNFQTYFQSQNQETQQVNVKQLIAKFDVENLRKKMLNFEEDSLNLNELYQFQQNQIKEVFNNPIIFSSLENQLKNTQKIITNLQEKITKIQKQIIPIFSQKIKLNQENLNTVYINNYTNGNTINNKNDNVTMNNNNNKNVNVTMNNNNNNIQNNHNNINNNSNQNNIDNHSSSSNKSINDSYDNNNHNNNIYNQDEINNNDHDKTIFINNILDNIDTNDPDKINLINRILGSDNNNQDICNIHPNMNANKNMKRNFNNNNSNNIHRNYDNSNVCLSSMCINKRNNNINNIVTSERLKFFKSTSYKRLNQNNFEIDNESGIIKLYSKEITQIYSEELKEDKKYNLKLKIDFNNNVQNNFLTVSLTSLQEKDQNYLEQENCVRIFNGQQNSICNLEEELHQEGKQFFKFFKDNQTIINIEFNISQQYMEIYDDQKIGYQKLTLETDDIDDWILGIRFERNQQQSQPVIIQFLQ